MSLRELALPLLQKKKVKKEEPVKEEDKPGVSVG